MSLFNPETVTFAQQTTFFVVGIIAACAVGVGGGEQPTIGVVGYFGSTAFGIDLDGYSSVCCH